MWRPELGKSGGGNSTLEMDLGDISDMSLMEVTKFGE